MDLNYAQSSAVLVTLPGFRLLERIAVLEALSEASRAGVKLSVTCVHPDHSSPYSEELAAFGSRAPSVLFLCAGHVWPSDFSQDLERQLSVLFSMALASGSLVCAIGGGVLALARMGLLSGRKAAVSCSMLPQVRCQFPCTDWVGTGTSVRDGSILTCSGIFTAAVAALSVLEALGHSAAVSEITNSSQHPGQESQSVAHLEIPPIPPVHPALQRVDDLLSRDPAFPWTTFTLARSSYVSERHLQRLFREVLGCGVFDYLQRKRLARAAEILQSHPLMALQRVAEVSGFSSTQHLRRAWKKHYGVNPSDSRCSAIQALYPTQQVNFQTPAWDIEFTAASMLERSSGKDSATASQVISRSMQPCSS